jgi:hypothetical protein
MGWARFDEKHTDYELKTGGYRADIGSKSFSFFPFKPYYCIGNRLISIVPPGFSHRRFLSF